MASLDAGRGRPCGGWRPQRDRRDQPVNGSGGTFAAAVGHWASQTVFQVPVDIADLVQLDKRRTRRR